MSAVRLLAGTARGPLDARGHLHVHGPLPPAGPELIELVAAAGLRGRGGAGFATAEKLRRVAATRGPRAVLVNAAEGDPLSAKDRHLLAHAPHLVLDGAVAAAAAVGARRIVIALREDASAAHAAVRRAIGERRDAERVELCAVPTAYLAGEESALIRHLNGGPLLPTVVPPFPAQRGLRRRPTLVQNPETLAHLALIARHGARWFRAVGTADRPGTALVTVSGAVRTPSVHEVALGTTTFDDLLAGAGGPDEPLRAVLVGGYHGAWVDAGALDGLRLDDADLARHGASLGAGIVMALGVSACPAQELAQGVGWLAAQSAHQCGPCANGLPALAGLVAGIAAGRPAPAANALLERWSSDLRGRGACHLPEGAVRMLTSGLRVFAAELSAHAYGGPCPACRWPTTIAVPSARGRAAA